LACYRIESIVCSPSGFFIGFVASLI